MAISVEKNGEDKDIVINGFENGVQPSPHKGIANIQNANISTEMGEVMASFSRVQDTMTSSATGTGSLTFADSSHVNLSIAGSNNLFKGSWLTVTSSSNTTQLPNGTYYVPPSAGSTFQLQQFYNSQTYTLPVTANYVAVGGGGGGGGTSGSTGGGGGGEGGQVQSGTSSLTAQTYPIVIGPGGAGSAGGTGTGTTGTSSSALSVTALGGIGGGQGSGTPGAGGTGNGGSNGGAGGNNAAMGSNGTNGTSSSISGTNTPYGGGGAGGNGQSATTGVGSGGTGGGGAGGVGGSGATNGSNGTVNTGGGGGGAGAKSATDLNGSSGGSGIVIISYPTGSIVGATGGSITQIDVAGVGYNVHTFTASGSFVVPAPTIPPQPLTGFTAGLTATIQLVAVMGKPIAKATETYYASGVVYNRYYILDNQNLVWVYDTQNEVTYSTTDNVNWILPDFQTGWATDVSGIAVISGFLVATSTIGLWGKPVSLLGNTNSTATTWVQFPGTFAWSGGGTQTSNPHFCYVGHQGTMYITDNSYIASVFPDATLADAASTADNVQIFASWTYFSGITGSYSIISGTTAVTSDNKRLPVVFFTNNGGSLPTSISSGTVYYIDPEGAGLGKFQAYSASTGGSPLDIVSGAYGTQYFNSFYPIASASGNGGGTPTLVFTNQRLTLPGFEIAQCMAEIGNLIVVGCAGSTIYPWNQSDNLPSSIISLPEANVPSITTVHQMAYIPAGNKGNIYITDGSVASLVTTVPDYCAGVPGTPASYIEPTFSWGDFMYLRGRVFFSILDQTSTKAGNCGGVWSFVPTQNFYVGQDVGIALHLENQNSYGTYNGLATVLIPKQNQNKIAPQYFSGWESSISSPLYGIDATGTGTNASSVVVIESDYIPAGTMLQKKTFKQFEYKLAAPLTTGESVSFKYRQNLTDAWSSFGTLNTDTSLSGYYPATFEKGQGLQIQVTLTPSTGSTGSFNRFLELRLR